jgi:hypothetical protein
MRLGEDNGYSDTQNVFHVVHNHKWRPFDFNSGSQHFASRFLISHPNQMVSNAQGEIFPGVLYVDRNIQNIFLGFQCSSICLAADHGVKKY